MWLNDLIVNLLNLSTMGFSDISFFVDDDIVPSDYCSFEISSYNSKEIILCNYIDE